MRYDAFEVKISIQQKQAAIRRKHIAALVIDVC